MKIYLVGGAVRDKLLGLPVHEQDYVVVGATAADMLAQGFKQVGKKFPVFLHPKTGAEYALARMERKTKPGYKGFEFDASPQVTLEEDLRRRDLTINAMAYDLETGTLIDPFGGQADLKSKTLKHVSSAFAEDPVRILRLGRFLARFAGLGFTIHTATISLMREMVARGEVNALVAERVWKELERTLSEKNPDQFFIVLESCKALPILFPGLTQSGRKALQAATAITTHAATRFAALLHDYSDQTDKTCFKETIAALCHRYRAPNFYRELAVITALHHQQALSQSLNTEDLLSLFAQIDIYRREKRFQHFLDACQAIALSRHENFKLQALLQAAAVVKSIDVKKFIKAGFSSGDLANELRKARKEKLDEWLRLPQNCQRPLS